MIRVDNMSYSLDDFSQRYSEISKINPLSDPVGQLYAVCLPDAFAVLSTVLYLQEQGGSVLLFHGDTPREQVLQKAQLAGCDAMIFGRYDAVEVLAGDHEESEPSLYQFSSGTTGAPKLIKRSFGEVAQEVASYNERLKDAAGERPIVMVPVSHSFGLISGVLSGLARGEEPIIVQDKNPKFALGLLRKHPHSAIFAVPFQFHLLHTLSRDEISFHRIVSAGAPFTAALLTALQNRSRVVMQQYGCTEAGCISIGSHPEAPSDVGQALANIEIQAGTASDAPEEIEVHLPLQQRTILTHDYGYWNASGRLHVLGRADDLINVSGLKVFPTEIESVLSQMPGVQEVAVYKSRHKIWGDAVAAQIVVEGALTVQDIRDWCLTRLAPYQAPSVIHLVEKIQKTETGKINRKILQEMEL